MIDSLAYTIVGFLLFAGAFIILRFFFLWYWKVDTIVKNQEETNRILGRILAEAEDRSRDN